MADIIYLSNGMEGDIFRVAINNNFQRINEQLGGIIDTESKADTIYTEAFIDSVEYVEGSIQVVMNDKGVEVYKLVDNEWAELCKYTVDGSGMLSITGDSAGVGYSTKEETAQLTELQNLPVGYKSDGTLVVAGTVEIEGKDPIECVGWFKDSLILTSGRIEIPEDKEVIAGQAVYVDGVNTGWTLEKPVESDSLVQVIGRVSDDCKYINIQIMAWCIAN